MCEASQLPGWGFNDVSVGPYVHQNVGDDDDEEEEEEETEEEEEETEEDELYTV